MKKSKEALETEISAVKAEMAVPKPEERLLKLQGEKESLEKFEASERAQKVREEALQLNKTNLLKTKVSMACQRCGKVLTEIKGCEYMNPQMERFVLVEATCDCGGKPEFLENKEFYSGTVNFVLLPFCRPSSFKRRTLGHG